MNARVRTRLLAVCALSAMGTPGLAVAQTYPGKPIRFVMPYPPGGGTDFVLRVLAQKLTESWKQQMIVDSRPGGAGSIGMQIAAKAPNDGYTLLLSAVGPITVNPSLFTKLSYDPVADFEPITTLISALNMLVVHPSLPVHNVKDLIALARARPGQLRFASSSHGNTDHLAGELFKGMTRVDMIHVPYKGGAAASIDLLGGQIELMFANYQNVSPHVTTGKLRAVAAASSTRWPTLPSLPTIAESGVPGFDVNNWYGLLAPARTSRDIIAAVNAEVLRILELPDVKERLASQGMIPFTSSPEKFAAYIKSETAKWAVVVKASGARID